MGSTQPTTGSKCNEARSLDSLTIFSSSFFFWSLSGHFPSSASAHNCDGCQDEIQSPRLALQALVTAAGLRRWPFPTLLTAFTLCFQPADSPSVFMTQLKLIQETFSKALKVTSPCSAQLQQKPFDPFSWQLIRSSDSL